MIELIKTLNQNLLASESIHSKPYFYLAEDENHMSVVPTTISRILRWLS